MATPRTIARSFVQVVSLLAEVGTSEVYRAQARRARSPKNAAVLKQIQAHEATHACEARARVDAPEAIRRAAETLFEVGGSLVGRITSMAGDRAVLAFDYGLERLVELNYRAALRLLTDEARPSDRRVLKRALEEECEHQALIRDRLGI